MSRISRDQYNLRDYGEMILDPVRMAANEAALTRVITRDSIVLDLGAGTGIFSLLACKLGAKKVYAVEPSDSILVAAALAKSNGFSDRIEFLQKSSFDVSLPERADVVISDLRGALPLYGQHIPSIVDARRRLLKDGGCLIPRLDEVKVQLVSDAQLHAKGLAAWGKNMRGLDLSAARQWAMHQWRKADLSKSTLIGTAATLATLDYQVIDSANVKGTVDWHIEEGCPAAHGLAAWFDATVTEGIGFSSHPARPKTVYEQAYFPFPEAISLSPGDRVSVQMQANLMGNNYVWRWDTSVLDTNGSQKHQFRQSSFQAEPQNLFRLQRRAKTHVPGLTEEGEAVALILLLMQQSKTLESISVAVAKDFPGLFKQADDAHDFVAAISEKFSKSP